MDEPLVLPVRMIERLSGYRRHLRRWVTEKRQRIFSHELGGLVGSTPAQVRRDLMTIGFTGSPARGYDVAKLIESISAVLDPPEREGAALVGVGSLGRAILRYLSTAHPEIPIMAAFDVAPDRVGGMIDGCRCYPMTEMEAVLEKEPALIGIITVPSEAAQDVANDLIRAGVRGIMNFTAVRLHTPPEVFVEDIDISISLEKVVFFSRSRAGRVGARA